MRNTQGVYAARPLANCLLSDSDVPIWPYRSGETLVFDGPGVPMAFTGVDLDLWGLALAEAVDRVGAAGGSDELPALQTALAERFSELLLPVFADEAVDPEGLAAAREAYRQELLTGLVNAYVDHPGGPVRGFPGAPALVAQTSTTAGMLEWRYSVEYAQADRAPQDQIYFTLSPEMPAVAPRASAPNSLLRALAEFATVYPEMREDLEGADPTALASFVNVVALVVREWSAVTPVAPPSLEGMATITEFARDGRLVMRVDGGGEVMAPGIDGYTTLDPPTAAPFDYEFAAADGSFLGAEKGTALPLRQLLSPPREILESRTGTFGAMVVRNAQLLFPQTRATAPEFVYYSELVTFPSPLFPNIDSGEAVALTQFSAPGSTLAAYLKGFFAWLFGTEAVAVESDFSGEYEVDGAPFPIFLAKNVVGAPDPEAVERVVAQWIGEIQPAREGATLRFALTVMSTASGAPVLLLRLRDVSVRVGEVGGL